MRIIVCVPWEDYKTGTADLKKVYESMIEEEALLELEKFSDRWDDKYPPDQSIVAQYLAQSQHLI